MEIGIRLRRHVVVDDNVYSLNVDSTTEDFSGNHDSLVEILETLVSVDSGNFKRYGYLSS